MVTRQQCLEELADYLAAMAVAESTEIDVGDDA